MSAWAASLLHHVKMRVAHSAYGLTDILGIHSLILFIFPNITKTVFGKIFTTKPVNAGLTEGKSAHEIQVRGRASKEPINPSRKIHTGAYAGPRQTQHQPFCTVLASTASYSVQAPSEN